MTDTGQQITSLSPAEKRDLLAKLLKEKASASITDTPLSYNQLALWFLYQLAPDSTAYNVAFAARIHSPVDIPALKQAMQKLVNRHASLRTTFSTRSGRPVQQIHGYWEVHFEETDASAWDEEALHKQAIEAYRCPFDLENGPLLRVNLFRQSTDTYVLLIVVHHIVLDAWSLWILLDELRELYGDRASLLPLGVNYKDFVSWQADMLASPEGERLWSYWREQLAGELSPLNLPTNRPRPPFQTFNGATKLFTLDPELSQQIKDVARAQGATLYMLLLAALQVLLHRYTGQNEILVGSPTSGRNQPEFEDVIGDFINMAVLRANLGGNPSFATFLGQVRQTVLAALVHQDYPFSLLVEQLAPDRDPSRSQLFQVSFVFQKPQRAADLIEFFLPRQQETPGNSRTRIDFGGLDLTPYPLPQQEGQFDLTLEMTETAGSLLGALKFNTDLFDEETGQRMAGHFQMLLKSIAANPDQLISSLRILTEPEMHQLLQAWNETEVDDSIEACIHELFEAQAGRTPESVAVVCGKEALTYDELNRRANQLAHYLQQRGVSPGVLVGICVDRSLDMMVGLLGVLKAGGTYVPLDPAFPQERLNFMLTDSRASILLTQQQLRAELFEAYTEIICLDDDWGAIAAGAGERVENPASQATADNLAYVIYTSGSTGRPKGVQIPHRAAVNFLKTMADKPGMSPQDVLMAVTTLSFDISLLELFLPLSLGAKVVIADRNEAADGPALMKALAHSHATVMQATPATWRLLLDSGWPGSRHLKVLCGGEALPPDLADQLLEKCGSLWNMYGPTETTVWSTICQLEPGERPISIGRPIANTEIYILDDQLQPVPVGVPGVLYIGGAGLARGYLNRPALTAEKFIDHPFRKQPGARIYNTGDLARYLPDGRIECLGRIDHQIKLRGYRIELGEIEAALAQHPIIEKNVVIVREDRPGDKRLVAYFVCEAELMPPATELRAFLKQKLPDYMVPAVFMRLEALPLTPNGKINRRALPEPEGTRPELDSTYVAPQTPIEEEVAQIWTEILGIERIGIHDNFFDLGGHSLLATQVLAHLRDSLHIDLSLREMFGDPSIAGLALTITQQLSEQEDEEELLQMIAELKEMSEDDLEALVQDGDV